MNTYVRIEGVKVKKYVRMVEMMRQGQLVSSTGVSEDAKHPACVQLAKPDPDPNRQHLVAFGGAHHHGLGWIRPAQVSAHPTTQRAIARIRQAQMPRCQLKKPDPVLSSV